MVIWHGHLAASYGKFLSWLHKILLAYSQIIKTHFFKLCSIDFVFKMDDNFKQAYNRDLGSFQFDILVLNQYSTVMLFTCTSSIEDITIRFLL